MGENGWKRVQTCKNRCKRVRTGLKNIYIKKMGPNGFITGRKGIINSQGDWPTENLHVYWAITLYNRGAYSVKCVFQSTKLQGE